MKIIANAVQIKDLIPKNPPFYYQIPRYQREYIWGKTQITDLYNDITENASGIFLGPIICINDNISQVNEVIDGQQRLTTLCILLGVLYKELKDIESSIPEDDKDILSDIRKSLRTTNKNSQDQLILVPQQQNHNDKDFEYAMSEMNIIHPKTAPNYYGNRMIARAKKILIKLIEDDLNSCSDGHKKWKKLKEIYDKVQASELVKIEVNNHFEAYMLFESLNNRGVPLTAIELMKNKMMSETDKNHGDIIGNDGTWKYILDLLADDILDNYKVQERFFRHHYNAFISDIKKKYSTSIGFATRSNLLKIYEVLIEKSVPDFLNEITDSAKIYHELINPTKCSIKQSEQPLLDLQHVQAAPSYMLLLYLVKERQTLQLSNDKTIIDIINLLVKFFIRRNLTDTPNTRDLDRLFMGIIKEIETQKFKGQDVYKLIEKKLNDVSADTNRFIDALMGNIYTENRDATRFVLCKLAENGMTKQHVGLWDRDKKGNYIWTIEHVFPEGKNLPQEWIQMMTGNINDVAKAATLQEQYVHRLGNLTLTGYNSSLSNRPFNDKKKHQDSNGNYIGYMSGLNINADIVKASTWTVAEIEQRTVNLINDVITQFKLSKDTLPQTISFKLNP